MRALTLLAATLLLSACAGAPGPSGTAASAASPSVASSPGAQATVSPSLDPSPTTASVLPNPGGSAINGPIVYSTAGDVFSLDPATGLSTLIIGGPTTDEAPYFSPDGKKLVTHRSDDGMLYISDRDGSGLTPWADDKELMFWTWSPDSSRIAAISAGGTAHDLIIWDGGAGLKTHLNVDAPANFPIWIDLDTLLLVQEKDYPAVDYWTVNIDGTGLTHVPALHPCCLASIDSKTARLAYSDFVLNRSTSSSVHIRDLDTGVESILNSTVAAATSYLRPLFSPDGLWIVADQFAPGLPAHRPVLLAADGTGAALPLGPNPATNQDSFVTFSPDSTRVLITRADGTYLFSIPEGQGGRVDWPIGVAGPEENSPVWPPAPG